MKYWAYFDGDIEGPYSVGELLTRGGAGPATLVSPEESSGDAEGDWQRADYYPELASALGVPSKAPSPRQGAEQAPPVAEPAPPLDILEMPPDEETALLSEELLALQQRMEQLGVAPEGEDDETEELEQERKRLAEQVRLRHVIRRRTARMIEGLEAGLDKADRQLSRQIRRLESARLQADDGGAQELYAGGIRALGPLAPDWHRAMESNELFQIAASDTALFSALSSGQSVVVPDKPAWPERKVPAPGKTLPPAGQPQPRPPERATERRPQPAKQVKPVLHPFQDLHVGEAPKEEPIQSQEPAELVRTEEPVSVEMPHLEPITPAPAEGAAQDVPAQESEQAPSAEQAVPMEQPVVETGQPASAEPAQAQASVQEPAAEPEEKKEPLKTEPAPITLPSLGKPAIKQPMSDADFPFSPKYLAKSSDKSSQEPALPSTTARSSLPLTLPQFDDSSKQQAAEQQSVKLQSPLSSVMGAVSGSTGTQLPPQTSPGQSAASFALSDTVPKQQESLGLSIAALDPRLGDGSKTTLAPSALVNLSKTTMYGDEESGSAAPGKVASAGASSAKPEGAKPFRNVRTLVMLLVVSVLAVVGAIVFFFIREDAGVKGAASAQQGQEQPFGSKTGTATSTQTGTETGAAVPKTESPAQKPPETQAQEPFSPQSSVPSENKPSPAAGAAQAVEIAKNHDLGMGRGKLETWLKNSYGVSGQEDWSATQLLGDVYVVQYRLLRQRAEPIAYQFEVNVSAGKLSKGINNAAIELLGGTQARPASVVKTAAPRKPVDKRRQAGRRG